MTSRDGVGSKGKPKEINASDTAKPPGPKGGGEAPAGPPADIPGEGPAVPGKSPPRDGPLDATDKYRGGRHRSTKGPTKDGLESHHMPADSINGLPTSDEGPAIQMEPEDHARTASNGKMPGSDLHRARQQKLIKQGRFGEAIQMDIDDIRLKFGSKYDRAIKEMIDGLDPSMKNGLKG